MARRPVMMDENLSRRSQIDETYLDVTIRWLHAYLFDDVLSF